MRLKGTPIAIVLFLVVGSGCAHRGWMQRSEMLRGEMREILTLPEDRVPLDAVTHRTISEVAYRIDSITYASEPGSRVTALLYLPNEKRVVPAVVVACGHGGSKSCFYAQYAGQLYARLGFACLLPDTIDEEERQVDGRMGARGHDMYHLGDDNPEFVRTKLKRIRRAIDTRRPLMRPRTAEPCRESMARRFGRVHRRSRGCHKRESLAVAFLDAPLSTLSTLR